MRRLEDLTSLPIEAVLDHMKMRSVFESALDRSSSFGFRKVSEQRELEERFFTLLLGSTAEVLAGTCLSDMIGLSSLRRQFSFVGGNRGNNCVVPDGILCKQGVNKKDRFIYGGIEVKSFGEPTAIWLMEQFHRSKRQMKKTLALGKLTIPSPVVTAEKIVPYPEQAGYPITIDSDGVIAWVKDSEDIIIDFDPSIKFGEPVGFYLALPKDAAEVIGNSWRYLKINVISLPYTSKEIRVRITDWTESINGKKAINQLLIDKNHGASSANFSVNQF